MRMTCVIGAHVMRIRGDKVMTNAAASASYNRNAARRAVNLSINEDLLFRAKQITKNLSATVEELLAGYLQQEHARRREEDEALEQVIAALNAFNERHGFLSDEFSNL